MRIRAVIVALAMMASRRALAEPTVKPPAMRVHIESPQPVTLQLRAGDQGTWVDECVAPCDKEIPLAREARVKGWEGTSPSLVVEGPSGRTLVLDVHKRSTMAGGIVLGVFGGLVIVVGGISTFVGVEALSGGTSNHEGRFTALGTFLVVAGVLGVAGGVGMVAGGVYLVNTDGEPRFRKRIVEGTSSGSHIVEGARLGNARLPREITVPVLQVAF